MFKKDPAIPSAEEAIHNVYELPSIERTIRYLHAAAELQNKATWINSIINGNYLTWPLITVKNVNKHFPESEETQNGHMLNQKQGVRSTKVLSQQKTQLTSESKLHPVEKRRNVFLTIYKPKEKVYTDQTGKFPYR